MTGGREGKPAQKVSRLDLGPAPPIRCSWRVVATCMYERVRRTGATSARPWGAYSKFRNDHTPPKPSQKASTLDLGPAEANRVLQKSVVVHGSV
jgi:hypothetical protein